MSSEFRYEIAIFWTSIQEWVTWRVAKDMGEAELFFERAVKDWPDFETMLWDTWSEEKIKHHDPS